MTSARSRPAATSSRTTVSKRDDHACCSESHVAYAWYQAVHAKVSDESGASGIAGGEPIRAAWPAGTRSCRYASRYCAINRSDSDMKRPVTCVSCRYASGPRSVPWRASSLAHDSGSTPGAVAAARRRPKLAVDAVERATVSSTSDCKRRVHSGCAVVASSGIGATR